MAGMVRWNLQELGSAINALEQEHSRLTQERTNMQTQQDRVGVSWQSQAGTQYQNRLSEDMTLLQNILQDLQGRIATLRRVNQYYSNAETSIRSAAGNLPR